MHSNMEDAEAASYFQLVLPTMSDVKGSGAGGHGRPVWVAGCRNDLLYDSHLFFSSPPFSPSLSAFPLLSSPAGFSFPMFFLPACHITF